MSVSLEKTAYIGSVISPAIINDSTALYGKLVQLLNKMMKNEGSTSTVAALNALTDPMPNLIVKMTDAGTLSLGSLVVAIDDYVYFDGLNWLAAEWISPVSSARQVYVNNVTDLEIAVAAQTAGQFIHLMPGTYNLTESLAIPLAADGGGLIGEGIVVINGAAAADEAIKINTADATGTFEYTIGGGIETKGGANKIALKIVNGASAQKTIVYVKDSANFLDNGTGVAISAVNTGTGAVRLYVNGNGQGFDTMNITPKVADDRFTFNNIDIDENMVVASVAVAATFYFRNCKIPHAGITGGNATNVIGFVGCWTEEVAFVPVAVDASDTPDGFSGTIL